MNPSRLTSEERRTRIQTWLDDYRIPGEVPKELRGAVLPRELASPEAFSRIAVRTLHTLLVRSPVDTLLLLDEGDDGFSTPFAIDSSDAWTVETGTIEVDREWRRRLLRSLSESTSVHALSDCDTFRAIAGWLTLLAPGVRIVPVRRRRGAEGSAADYGAQLGRVLAEAKVAVVAASLLTRYGASHSFVPSGVGPSGETWLVENDTRLIQRIRALDAEGVLSEAVAQKSAENPSAIAVAVGSARPRDSWSGHLIEYTHSHRESGEPIFTESVGMAGIVF